MPHISLVTLGVSDIAAATSFYESLSFELSTDSVAGTVSFLRAGATALGLYGTNPLREDANVSDVSYPSSVSACAINVSSPTVVDSILAAAERAGATVTKPAIAAVWGGYSGYFADPDGHLWEVAHNPSWELDTEGRVRMSDDPTLAPNVGDPQAELAAFRAQSDEDAVASGAPSSTEQAQAAVTILDEAHARVAELFAGASNNQIIAAMTQLTEMGMTAVPASSESAIRHAASGLVASLLTPNG